jgi:hypothetical protein
MTNALSRKTLSSAHCTQIGLASFVFLHEIMNLCRDEIVIALHARNTAMPIPTAYQRFAQMFRRAILLIKQPVIFAIEPGLEVWIKLDFVVAPVRHDGRHTKSIFLVQNVPRPHWRLNSAAGTVGIYALEN